MTQKYILNTFVEVVFFSMLTIFPSEAQVKHDLTLPNNTNIKVEGNKITIEGGTQVGKNLFHSFQDFSLSKGDIAAFNSALDIGNIIVRVTGTSASNIDGIISANGTANLFFSNPNGISFGQNARLNIGGSFLATTANAFMFPNGSEFSATNPQAPPLLAINVPIGLRFGNNPGAIQVNGRGQGLTSPSAGSSPIIKNSSLTGLSVESGKSLTLVGGDITLQGANLTAEQGQIELGSVNSGTVTLNLVGQKWSLSYQGISSFKDIHLSEQTLVDASGDNGGTISIEGKTVSLDTGSAILIQNRNSPSGKISVQASELLKISGISPTDGRFYSILRTESLGSGTGGNIDIFTKDLVLQGGGNLGTRSYSTGRGGNLTVNASNSSQLLGFSDFSPFFTSSIVTGTIASGNAGDITFTTGKLIAQDGGLITSLTRGTGAGGNIFLKANSIELLNSSELIKSGQDFVNYVPSYLSAGTFNTGNSGSLTIDTVRLIVGEKATVNTSSTGSGSAGRLTIHADDIEVSGTISSAVTVAGLPTQRGLGSPSVVTGTPGELTIDTKRLDVKGGLVSVRNLGTGDGGTLQIKADSISLDSKGSIAASTSSGEGGDIVLNVHDLRLRHNSNITSTAGNNGNGGNITINADTVVALENSDITANAYEGRGGSIRISTKGFFLYPDSMVTASSQKGINGTVEINTPQIDFIKTSLPSLEINTPQVTQNCGAQSQESTTATLVNAGSGGIPQNPNDTIDNSFGWNNNSASLENKESEEATVSEPTQKLIAAQGLKNNGDGTVSFIATPSETTPYGSLSQAPCLPNQQSQEEAHQHSQEETDK
ncbi:filamentous hemagglutinin N-terminal domain-containing protein (plasmid) [Nostoc sp. C052]|uniref:two-partner secretion domain-containing protein n=1 Tax=Nostoc sp. C052 TaxID=2576902 RepID=UPI0015C3DFE5|nr:filamentous hemagglutinin N-terminal domain-containing protein [Nostoc sp. C052]QLE45839.1 filamentous hemagglutinin N-terminal domain-containing protein [Nostoc sp. C052]